jgi:hypothetical protein
MLYRIVYSTVYNCCQFENFQITGCHCSNIKAVQDEGTGSLSLKFQASNFHLFAAAEENPRVQYYTNTLDYYTLFFKIVP